MAAAEAAADDDQADAATEAQAEQEQQEVRAAEDELRANIDEDPLSAYDIDVSQEAELLQTLRALCESRRICGA